VFVPVPGDPLVAGSSAGTASGVPRRVVMARQVVALDRLHAGKTFTMEIIDNAPVVDRDDGPRLRRTNRLLIRT
jgi:hypothetical protein